MVIFMRIALPSDNKVIVDKFEEAQEFTVYEVEDERVIDKWCVYPVGGFYESVPVAFMESHINVVLCDKMGIETKLKLRGQNIEMITAVTGDTESAVISYLSGENIGVMDTPPEQVTFSDRVDTGIYRSRKKLRLGGF